MVTTTSIDHTPSGPAVFFPFTYLSGPMAETLSLCFHRLVVYQPVGSEPVESLKQWIERGFLDTRIPLAHQTDEKVLKAQLKNWKSWALLNQGADLPFLKEVGPQLSPTEPMSPKLASQIKRGAGKTEAGLEDRGLSFQLFLLLAHDFDRQSQELLEQLAAVDRQKRALELSFRVDDDEEDRTRLGQEPGPVYREDMGRFMVERRLAAWNHLFQKAPASSNLLVTDSPSAHAFLVEEMEGTVAVLHLEIPEFQDTSHQARWKTRLDQIFEDLLTTPWEGRLQGPTEEACNRLKAMARDGQMATAHAPEERASLHCHLVPNRQTAALLNRCCGLPQTVAGEQGLNTVVCLVKHPGT